MTSTFVIKGSAEFLIHVSSGFEGGTKRVGHTVDSPTAFDLASTTEGGDTTRAMSFGHARWTVLLLKYATNEN